MSNKKPTIIFDISGVLVKENRFKILAQVGIFDVLRYIITHHKNPIKSSFATLKHIATQEKKSKKSNLTYLQYRGNVLPSRITDWQKGLFSNTEMLAYFMHHIERLDKEHFFQSALEKKLIMRITSTLINCPTLKKAVNSIKPVVKLLKELKAKGYPLLLLSNQSHESYEFFKTHYRHIADIFDGGIISAHVHLVKPDIAIYQLLLDTYNLDPANCIFIDDQQENLVPADHLGIKCIHYKNCADLRKKLISYGVL